MDYKVEGVRPRDKPKNTWTEVVERLLGTTIKQISSSGLLWIKGH